MPLSLFSFWPSHRSYWRSAPKKTPVPADAAQAEATKLIKEVYGDQWAAAKATTEKQALAEKLLGKANESKDDPASQFVLLRLARDIATHANDEETAFQAIDSMAETFQVDALEMKMEVLTKVAKAAQNPARHKSIAGEALKLVDKAIGQDKFAVADQLGKLALDEAQKAGDKELIARTQGRIAEVAEIAKAFEAAKAAKVTLEKTPDDPEANLVTGKYLCFVKGDWDKGLLMLALGSDEKLKALAKQELDGAASSAEQAKLGDGWWELAETQEGRAKKQVQRRPVHWYRQALPGLSGLMKDKVEKRLAKLDEPPSKADATAAPIGPQMAVAPFDEQKAKEHQEAWAKYLHVPVVQTNSIGMKLVLIPPGEFEMGSPKELIEEELRLHGGDRWYRDHLPGEGPQHRVRITKPYWLGATDVTQGEYQRVMGSNPSKFQGDPKRPVEQVSWDDAVEFCRKLSELPGEKAAKRRYGLPTEAQWEYACRAGTTTRWYSGDDEAGLVDVAWFDKNAGGQTHPVGQKKPNAWGLYDMHGNVWEWCQDWYDREYYAKSPTDDPAGPSGGSDRVLRGGSWNVHAGGCRSANRIKGGPGLRNDNLGLRVSLVAGGQTKGTDR